MASLSSVTAHRYAGSVATAAVGVTAATASWNAVAIGPVKPAPVALVLALVASGTAMIVGPPRDRLRIPAWVWALGAAVAVVTVLAVLWPAPEVYVLHRYLGKAPPPASSEGARRAADLFAGARVLAATVALPAAVCLTASLRPNTVRTAVDAWIAGASISALVALTDEWGITRISAVLLPVIDQGGRQAGLAVQANHAALGIAMTLPLVGWRAVHARGRLRVAPVAVALLLLGGLVTTGSRAGLVGVTVAVLGLVVVDRRLRRGLRARAPMVALAVVLVGLAAAWAVAGRGLTALRGGASDESDAIRVRLLEQALRDVSVSPVRGIGLQFAEQAHAVPLGIVAAGGVLLLLGFVATWLGVLAEGWVRRHREGEWAGALAVSGAVYLAAGLFGNQVADLYVSLPLALMAALAATSGSVSDRSTVR